MVNEIWKDIQGYEGEYQISNMGRVYSIKSGRIMKLVDDGRGYKQVNLCKDGKSYNKKIHRLVAQAFIPNTNNLLQVNHLDENKENNRVDNLEWVTAEQNINYGTRSERMAESRKKTYLIYKDGVFISSALGRKEISKITGINIGTIDAAICHNRTTRSGYSFRIKEGDACA